MARYAIGDDVAFGEVYDAIGAALFAYLERRVGDRAEDIVQHTFLNMHNARRSFVPGSAVLPWALTIARNLMFDALRRERAAPFALAADGGEIERAFATDSSPEEALHGLELAGITRDAIEALPSSQREAWTLVREGLSHAEAAAVLDTTVPAVKLRVFRACEALRSALEKAKR